MNIGNSLGNNAGLANAIAGHTGNTMAKDEFLKLLVTQLSHQDPLKPMESHEFASQLAQFSSLEQLQNMNGTMEEGIMSDYMMTQSINNTLATTLIGKTAMASGNDISFTGDPTTIQFKLNAPAETVTVTIKDSDGNIVKTITDTGFSEGLNSIEWNGENAVGDNVSAGEYSYSVSAYDGNEAAVSATPLIAGEIEGITFEEVGIVLMINGQTISLNEVLEIKQS
jgi:flagellar basal-body rod modification protein FlgD